jgi:DNA methylase
MATVTKERKFFNALRDIFIGAKVEGQSGFINLMRIKSRYYEQGIFPQLQKDITEALKPFPGFRDELFERLYDFFHRYFSESGSIYFRYTPLHQNVYEKVYTDDKDVMLFWKTHMLYYVKTDRLFKSMEVEVEGRKFFFDVSKLEHKKTNEKREIVYAFKEKRKDGVLAFDAGYSERGRRTDVDDILRALRTLRVTLNEDELERAFRVFEKQSEIDYFINKDAKAFLEEQFDLWLYQYVFRGMSEWTETRIKQLQGLRIIAFKIIAFISQFEDELVRIWNKPKFVLNSHYIITLDKVSNDELVDRILAHKGMKAQLEEWRNLGIVDDKFKLSKLKETNVLNEPAHIQYGFLPLDTQYFPDLEREILALFDDLDAALDGWLVHSENYQGLNSLLAKFREKVQVIYIDPPYNTDAGPIDYANNYRGASWLSLIENRLGPSKELLCESGILCITTDDYQAHELANLLDERFDRANQLGIVVIRNNPSGRSTVKGISVCHEYAFFYRKTDAAKLARLPRTEKQLERFTVEDGERVHWENFRKGGGAVTYRVERPKQFYPVYVNPKKKTLRIPELSWDANKREWRVLETPKQQEVIIWPVDEKGKDRVWSLNHISAGKQIKDLEVRIAKDGKAEIFRRHKASEGVLPRSWWDKSTYAAREYGSATLKSLFGESSPFSFAKSPFAVQDCVWIAGLNEETENLVIDYFAGSGTTAHAVINLNRADGGERKYLLIEMGEHFNTVIKPRIKKVVFSDNWKDGKAQKGQGISQFVKYYRLEQYEDALRRVKYQESDLFDDLNKDPYHQYVFLRDLKMLEALKVDTKKNEVKVDLSKLYDDIDIAETLSNLTGKWIKRITADFVEFDDGEVIDIKNLDWKKIKPLVWWS